MKSIYAFIFSRNPQVLSGLTYFFKNLEDQVFVVGTKNLKHIEEYTNIPAHEKGKITEVLIADLEGLNSTELEFMDILINKNSPSFSIALKTDSMEIKSQFDCKLSKESLSYDEIWKAIKLWEHINSPSENYLPDPFLKISAINFVKGNISRANVYKKLTDIRVERVLEENERYDLNSITTLLSEGNQELLISKKEYLKKQEEKTPFLESDLNDEQSYHRTILSTELICKQFNLAPSLLLKIREEVHSTILLLRKKKETSTLIRRAISTKNGDIGPAILLCYMCCAICSLSGWVGPVIRDKMILASLLHNIGLRKFPELIKAEATGAINIDMDVEQTSAWKDHPSESVSLLKKIVPLYPGLDTIIQMHHERPDGSGFPRKLDGQYITPEASLFITCLEATTAILKGDYNKEKSLEELSKIEVKLAGKGFSKFTSSLSSLFKNS